MGRRVLHTLTLLACAAAVVHGQRNETPSLAFDVASIKPNRSPDAPAKESMPPGGRYIATNTTLRFLIQSAYEPSPMNMGLAVFEFEGGPDWIRTERFDVNAKAAESASVQQVRRMLQTLLIDRFQLRVHYETRQTPIYRMVVANRSGALGKQLHRSDADCGRDTGDPYRGIVPGETYACGYFGPSPAGDLKAGVAYQAFRGMTLGDFARRLQPFLQRPVVDATGLAGYFDGTFEWTREVVMPPPPPGAPNPYDGNNLPSIFSVLPDQLGLKLESQRGPTQVLVIDGATRPKPN